MITEKDIDSLLAMFVFACGSLWLEHTINESYEGWREIAQTTEHLPQSDENLSSGCSTGKIMKWKERRKEEKKKGRRERGKEEREGGRKGGRERKSQANDAHLKSQC